MSAERCPRSCGMLSAITAECCPPSAWNRVRDRAEYARLGRNAMAVYQDLADRHGFEGAYNSVKRFAATLRHKAPEQFDHRGPTVAHVWPTKLLANAGFEYRPHGPHA